jgi:TRAP-type C4-dicarboxylate transport system permease large subunit
MMLGLSPEEAGLLTGRARARLGRWGYSIRLAALMVATTPVLGKIIPPSTRRRMIAPLIHAVMAGPAENLLYAGSSSMQEAKRG